MHALAITHTHTHLLTSAQDTHCLSHSQHRLHSRSTSAHFHYQECKYTQCSSLFTSACTHTQSLPHAAQPAMVSVCPAVLSILVLCVVCCLTSCVWLLVLGAAHCLCSVFLFLVETERTVDRQRLQQLPAFVFPCLSGTCLQESA